MRIKPLPANIFQEHMNLPSKPFKIFVIDANNNHSSSSTQESAYAELLQSPLNHEAEVICVELGTVFDWIPGGHIHVQGFGSLHILCHYEGDLQNDLIFKMNQIANQVRNIFDNNLTLVVDKLFNNTGNDAELNSMYLALQTAAGSMKYEEVQSNLAAVIDEHLKHAEGFIDRSTQLAKEMVETNRNFMKNVMEQFEESKTDINEFETKSSLLENEFRNQMSVLDDKKEVDAIATLAKQRPLRIKESLYRFFANKIAEDYRLPQAVTVQDHSTELQKKSNTL